jgi:O-antigen/teichoic acid export membrane protein
MIEWWFILRFIARPRVRIDLKFSVQTIRLSVTFLGFQGTLALSNTLIFLFLSKFSDESTVGYYNAANQILTPVFLIFQSVVFSAFPIMCRSFVHSIQSLKLLSDNLIEMLLAITSPVIIGTYFLSEEILLLLYGNPEFIQATGVLRVMLFSLILRAVVSVLGRDLLASNREQSVLYIVLISSVVNVISGYFLIRVFGLMGAAVTAVIFAATDFILNYLFTGRLFSAPIPWQRLWKPVAASGALLASLLFLNVPYPFMKLLIGCGIYVVVLFLLNVRSAGSLKQFKLIYQSLWHEQYP